MMDCRNVRNLAEQMSDGSLSETDAVEWRTHVESCNACRGAAQDDEQLNATLSLMSDLPQAPANLHSRVTIALKSADRWGPGTLPLTKRPLFGVALMAGTVAAVCAVAWVSYRAGRGRTPSPVRTVEQEPAPQTPVVVKPPTMEPQPEVTQEKADERQDEPRKPRTPRRPLFVGRASPPQPPKAGTLVAVAGKLHKRDDRSDWQPVEQGSVVRAGELLRTGASSTATLTLLDSSTVELKSNTVLQVRRDCLAQFAGELFASVSPQSRAFVIKTPTARVQALGTKFTVAVERKEHVRVAVVEGTVKLSNASGATEVDAGEEAVAEVGATPTVSTPEPPPPPPAARSVIEIRAEAAEPGKASGAAGGPPSFYVVLDYKGTPHQPLTLRATVTDANGQVVLETEEPLSTEQFRYTRRPMKIPLTEPGKYQVRFWLESEDGIAETTATFSVRKPAAAVNGTMSTQRR